MSTKVITRLREAVRTAERKARAAFVRLTPTREPRVRKRLQVAFACTLVLFILVPDGSEPKEPFAAATTAVQPVGDLASHARHAEERAAVVLAVVSAYRLCCVAVLWWIGYSVRFSLHILLLGGGGGLVGIGLFVPLTAALAVGVYLVSIGHTWEVVNSASEVADVPESASL